MATPDASLCGIPLKWISLVLMVTQMVGMVIILRVSRTQHVDGLRYLNTTAVLFSEIVKFLVSFCIHCLTSKNLAQCSSELWLASGGHPKELLKTSIPSLLYTAQNNLLFIGLSHLSAGLYQVTYQFKILTTAGLSVLILGTKLNFDKWLGLFVLTTGVVLVNMSGRQAGHAQKGGAGDDDTFLGLAAVISACFTSGLAGVYTEKIMKQSSVSLWIRNMQLGFFGSCFALCIALQSDGGRIRQDGWLQGYSVFVWLVVANQAIGGLLVAAVIKYAGNILKCFGCAISIIFTCLLSVLELHEFTPDARFFLGTLLVLVATAIYSLGLPFSNGADPSRDIFLPLFNRLGRKFNGVKVNSSIDV
eukprot:TRINITY_DN16540_c0_g1_i1.p1 TRINITY_DN16540_c0_g1~~TRINITY_DN16540_c0_g1_i1.p1  ORF type:complete len:361 (+),score=38.16 TRINITY_DN16540_c0_g1_i1:54-1136(+)